MDYDWVQGKIFTTESDFFGFGILKGEEVGNFEGGLLLEQMEGYSVHWNIQRCVIV